MNANQLPEYVTAQEKAVQALAAQLDEVQVAFNARFDQFKAQHDAALAEVSELVAERYEQSAGRADAVPEGVRRAVEERLPGEREKIAARRTVVRDRALPASRQAADAVLSEAQAELAELRALNPQLDEKEEAAKKLQQELQGRMVALNEEIRRQSRGLGVVTHFLSILKADQERQRTIGRLEEVNETLRRVRDEWNGKRQEVSARQAELQERWQAESVEAARLQAELDRLDDPARAEGLALRRAIYATLDGLAEAEGSADAELDAGLRRMAGLNAQTEAYHEGLGVVAGLMGLLGGIAAGLRALLESVEGLRREQEMHRDYLEPLRFELPPDVRDFHEQWRALERRFADETAVAAHPAEFSAAVKPLLEEELSPARIEAMFNSMGQMIRQATLAWK